MRWILGILLMAIVPCVTGIFVSSACTSCISNIDCLILWKHRDTGSPYNFVAHHLATDSTLEYIALHNRDDVERREAWIGMNRAGLAVMNTASYNLAPDTAVVKDREGLVMTMALERCHTVDDFASLLDTLSRPMGIQANFGVIDANGEAAYFEACDTGYTRFEALRGETTVRTNYSHSGGNFKQLGLQRERVARHFLDGKTDVTPCYLTDTLSCSFYDVASGTDLSGRDSIPDTGNFIPRYISTASIAIEAVPSPQGDGSNYVMWTRLGYPPGAETYRVTFNSIPAEVKPGPDGITPSEHKAERVKQRVYHRRGNKYPIIDTTCLQP